MDTNWCDSHLFCFFSLCMMLFHNTDAHSHATQHTQQPKAYSYSVLTPTQTWSSSCLVFQLVILQTRKIKEKHENMCNLPSVRNMCAGSSVRIWTQLLDEKTKADISHCVNSFQFIFKPKYRDGKKYKILHKYVQQFYCWICLPRPWWVSEQCLARVISSLAPIPLS